MFNRILCIAFPLVILSACGGGGGDEAELVKQSHDNVNKAITAALPAVATSLPKMPTAQAFTGAFTAVEGVSAGWIAGTNEHDVVAALVSPIVNNPDKYAVLYKMLLSDAGLKVTLFGKSVGTSKINGMTLYAPDRHAVVRLRADGMHIVFVS